MMTSAPALTKVQEAYDSVYSLDLDRVHDFLAGHCAYDLDLVPRPVYIECLKTSLALYCDTCAYDYQYTVSP